MNEKKIFSYINFAIKAGNIVYGIDNIKATKKPVYCVVLCKSATKNLIDTAKNYCIKQNVPYIATTDSTIDDYMHTKNCKVVGITNKDISQQIIYLNSIEE